MENIEILILLFGIAIFLLAFSNQTIYQSKYQPTPNQELSEQNKQPEIQSVIQPEYYPYTQELHPEAEQDQSIDDLMDYTLDADNQQMYQPVIIDYIDEHDNQLNQPKQETNIETMAPLSFGTYQNNYPRGSCNVGSFARTDCMVGNCPIDSMVTDKTYCKLQCAQDPDQELRADCERYCEEMLTNNCD
jgi:hypothetical protein